jgi:NAD(P)H-dependent flavin oxidoreductase YrpB (nitropropane dioxygenase family)
LIHINLFSALFATLLVSNSKRRNIVSNTSFPKLKLKNKLLLPIVQGGMGVGVSAHRLAGSVAKLGALGTISSVDLRRHHPDLMAQTEKSRDKELINKVNLIALDREIKAAKALAGGKGMIAVNVMRAVAEYAAYVRQACESGADAIVVGAGLPMDLPELTADYPNVALIPILSDVRGIALILKKWMRRKRLPDAIVIENPQFAAGHLGAAGLDNVNDPHFAFAVVLEGTLALFKELGIARETIPLIVAGGIHTPAQVQELFALGASAIQLGTAFAVSEEGDAHLNFKQVADWCQAGRYRYFHELCRSACACGKNAMAEYLSGQGSQVARQGRAEGMHGRFRLSASMRFARRYRQGRAVLHRYATWLRLERRCQTRPVFPWFGTLAFR